MGVLKAVWLSVRGLIPNHSDHTPIMVAGPAGQRLG